MPIIITLNPSIDTVQFTFTYPIYAGIPTEVTITIVEGGSILTTFNGSIQITSSDPSFTNINYTYTSGIGSGYDNGVHTFSILFLTAGVQTLTLVDDPNGFQSQPVLVKSADFCKDKACKKCPKHKQRKMMN
jgi:hypothetical protein